jgi:hypothetical protein
MRNFETTCYYVASNLPRTFSGEEAARVNIAGNAEFEKCFVRVFEILPFRRVAQG